MCKRVLIFQFVIFLFAMARFYVADRTKITIYLISRGAFPKVAGQLKKYRQS